MNSIRSTTARARFLLAGAAVATTLTSGWTGWQVAHETRLRAGVAGLGGSVSKVPYRMAALDELRPANERWLAPAGQTRGGVWTYELFTPPEIYYDPKSRKFSIAPPRTEAAVAPADFGLELVTVRREPFRLQLVGFIGAEKSASGTFENVLTSEHFLARGGRTVADLDVTILDFEVMRVPVDADDPTGASERVAIALVRDERFGVEHTLTSRDRAQVGELVAVVSLSHEPTTRYELHEGEALERDDVVYRVETLSAFPAEACVTKESSGQREAETKTLLPRG